MSEKLTCYAADGQPFCAAAAPDLSFLMPYGKVFSVQTRLSSGTLCFGVNGPYGTLFIKYAGAQLGGNALPPEKAIERLRRAAELYERFRHPSLTELCARGDTREGYALVFRYVNAIPLLPEGNAGQPGVRRQTGLPLQSLSLETRLRMLDGLFELESNISEQMYFSIDWNLSNLLLDAHNGRLYRCDIDEYVPKPCPNKGGAMPGTDALLAPECFIPGEMLTDRATVYSLGALSFLFFGDVHQLSREAWYGPSCLFPVAQKAVQQKANARYESVSVFLSAWREAVGKTHLRQKPFDA